MTQLTLSVDEEVAEKAERLANKRGSTVSDAISQLVRAADAAEKEPLRISPIARELTGIITLPEGKTDREIIEGALMEHYGFKP